MGHYEGTFLAPDCKLITAWENNITDSFKTFGVAGNKDDGTAAYMLITLPSAMPKTNLTVQSCILRIPETNEYASYRGPNPLTIKVSRITGAWNENIKWNTPPARRGTARYTHPN